MALFEQTTSERTGGAQSRYRSSTGVEPGEGQRRKSVLDVRFETGPSRKDILHFTNQLAVMIKAGISLQDSLESIAANVKKEKFRAIILDLKGRIEAGESFSQALGEHRDVFNNLYINMVAAAEISGSLSSMLQQLAGYLDQEAETRSQVIGAMVYPVIILVMAVVTTLFLLLFVLPRFLAIFAGKEHLLPAPTKAIMAASNFMHGYWFILLPAVVGVFWLLWFLTRAGTGQRIWHTAKLRVPLLKTLCRSLYITRSMHTMGVLTNAGVPILDTIMITSQISGNVLFESMWKGVHEAVRQGKKIAASLTGYDLMPGSVVQMIQSGEESGTLSEVLQDVSEFYARELKSVIKMVTSMIEPIMIVLMGLLVGFIAMSVILPIFRISRLVTS